MVGLFLSPNFTAVVTAVVTATGPWMLEVKQAGRYPATLQQYPQEANKPVIAVRAKIEIVGKVDELLVKPERRGEVFEMDLLARPTKLTPLRYNSLLRTSHSMERHENIYLYNRATVNRLRRSVRHRSRLLGHR
jgi:hypothetical protein